MASTTARSTSETHAGEPSRLSLSLTGTAMAAVREMAREHGVSEGEVVRRAISLLKLYEDETARGTTFRLQSPGRDAEILRILYT